MMLSSTVLVLKTMATTPYQKAWYAANRDRIREVRRLQYLAIKEDPEAMAVRRAYAAKTARDRRAALKVGKVPVTADERRQHRIATDPEYAARLQASAERRLADSKSRSRARYHDPANHPDELSWRKARRRTHPVQFLYNAAKARAKRNGITFTIAKQDVVVPETCPICHVAIHVADTRWAGNSPTLDRIDPARGYVTDNVAVICFNCNAVKSNGTAELHECIAAYMRKGGK